MKKKLLIPIMAIIILLSGIFFIFSKVNHKSVLAQADTNYATPDTVIEMLLFREAEKNVNSFYQPYFSVTPNIDPVSMEILNINQASAGYDVTLQLSPYFGAHNSIGKDIITTHVTTRSIITKKFEHVESYDVLDMFKEYVIKWPPQ